MSDKSRFFKQKRNKKVVGIILHIKFSIHYKTCWHSV